MVIRHQDEAARFLIQFQRWDAESFISFCRLISHLTCEFIRRLIANAKNADDFVQNAKMIPWQFCRTFQVIRIILVWLCNIVWSVMPPYDVRKQSRERSPHNLAPIGITSLISLPSDIEAVSIMRDTQEFRSRLCFPLCICRPYKWPELFTTL